MIAKITTGGFCLIILALSGCSPAADEKVTVAKDSPVISRVIEEGNSDSTSMQSIATSSVILRKARRINTGIKKKAVISLLGDPKYVAKKAGCIYYAISRERFNRLKICFNDINSVTLKKWIK